MSLPDGAEYWADVRGDNRRYRYEPTHLVQAKCHLRGSLYTNDASLVDCHFCKALMTPEVLEQAAKAHANNLRNRAQAEKKKKQKREAKLARQHGLGLCDKCGKHMIKRQNRKDGTFFKGCSGFPSCRHTENFKLKRS